MDRGQKEATQIQKVTPGHAEGSVCVMLGHSGHYSGVLGSHGGALSGARVESGVARIPVELLTRKLACWPGLVGHYSSQAPIMHLLFAKHCFWPALSNSGL